MPLLVVFALVLVFVAQQAAATEPLIVIGVDGLSARHAFASEGYQRILEKSTYTMRARTVEHTRSREAWVGIFAGGYDSEQPLGPHHPPMFTHLRRVAPSLTTYHIGSYYWAREAAGWHDGDFYDYAHPSPHVVDTLFHRVDQDMNGILPDLTLLYFLEADSAGHATQWGSVQYRQAVEQTAAQILRIHERFPHARMIITSDHGGRGGGHGYSGRNMQNGLTDIDAVAFRDVPFIFFPDSNPHPLCDSVRNSDVAWIVAEYLGVPQHPSWQRRAGWLDPANCTYADATPRDLIDIARASSLDVIPGAIAFALISLFAV